MSREPRARFGDMEMKLAAPDKVLVKVTDLGFGEFFAPGGRVWEESFQIG